jgi:hypothetical protein
MKSKLITVLSEYHQIEYDTLYDTAKIFDDDSVYLPALVSRISWLEYQAKLKVDSILELCRTGK